MSYEGFEEYICKSGHYFSFDAYQGFDPTKDSCPHCTQPVAYWRAVDETNGKEEDNPSSYPAELVEIGYEEVKHFDHLGNAYFTKNVLVAPQKEDLWRKLNGIELSGIINNLPVST